MVKSNIGKQVRIQVEHVGETNQTYTYSPKGTLDSVVVNWGRDNIYNAPRNRTASVTIAHATGGFQPGFWLYRKLSIKVGDLLVFSGTIDHARNRHFNDATGRAIILVELDAVEGGLFAPALNKERDVMVSNNESFPNAWYDDMRANGVSIQMQQGYSPTFAKFYEPVKLTMKRSLELAIESSRLLAHAEWLPNHQRVQPTIYRLWPTSPPTDYFPASNVEVADATATIEKTPKGWGVDTGGEYGNRTPWVYRDRFPYNTTGPRAQLVSPVQWDHNSQRNSGLFEETMRLVNYLQADPQKVTIIDGGKQTLNTTAHLRTWETPERGVKFTGQLDGPRFINPNTGKFDPVRAQDLHTDDWWYPIGGQLRISHDMVKHQWNAIKLIPEDANPSPIPR